jgi:hypothetical protein
MAGILIANAKHILPNGSCPACFGRVKIREADGVNCTVINLYEIG